MQHFTMSDYLSKEQMYKDKSEYLESVVKELVEVLNIGEHVFKDDCDDLWCMKEIEGGQHIVWGDL